MTENEKYALVKVALSAREKSYSPYSSFAVGAALLTDGNEIFTGANIESASYTPTICAERVAFFSAVHQGKRNFRAIAIVGGRSGFDVTDFTAPCGVCRQVMAEFADADFERGFLFGQGNSRDRQEHHDRQGQGDDLFHG